MAKGTKTPLHEAETKAHAMSRLLTQANIKHRICGSLRRGTKSMIGDIDVVVDDLTLACSMLDNPQDMTNRKTVKFEWNNINVNLYVAKHEEWGAMMLFLTGNAFFNRICRAKAIKKGQELGEVWKLNQYGLWKITPTGEIRLAGKTEEEIFLKLDMRNVSPSDREK